MREEKKYISAEYVERLKASPFLIAAEYYGVKVQQLSELRRRLREHSAEIHVVKNSIFSIAVAECGMGDIRESMVGQMAVVTGESDIAAAAKVLKDFEKEFEKPKIKFGILGSDRLTTEEVVRIADLPSLPQLQAQLLGVISSPATKIAQVLNAPAQQLAQVLKAKIDKDGGE